MRQPDAPRELAPMQQPGATPSDRAPRLPYRPGLDGLRALAVAGVVLYHAGVSWMPGGFLGVDAFFVLSGYLITSLLLAERSRRGSIALGRFWLRRARRLLPAVLLVIAVSLIAASTVARDALTRTRGDALASLGYVTNWHAIAASHSYFNAFGRPSLLQHLWSLAVEEQFYLVWPILLVGGLALLGRRRVFVLTLLAATASTTLMWALYDPNRDPSRVYYGTDTRAATLLVGALLAFAWPAARLRLDVGRRAAHLLDAIGVAALLALLACFWRARDYDPGLYRGGLLLVALCVALLVAVLAHPAASLGRFLGWGPIRWVGVRSYGIYLWHWPVMALTRASVDVPWHGAPLVIAQVAVTLGLAAVSYRFVEQPVRSGTVLRRLRAWLDLRTPRQRMRLAAATLLTAVLVPGLAWGLPAPAQRSSPLATPAALIRIPSLVSSFDASPVAAGSLSHSAGTLTAAAARGGSILAVGDSVMLGCAPALQQRLGSRLRVDAVVSRQAVDTIGRLSAYRRSQIGQQGVLPSTVIVQIGDNGPIWYADLQHLRRVLQGVSHVVLVNVRVARSWQGEVDRALGEYAPKWPQATIADWYGHSSERLLSDGVHPTNRGRGVYVQVMVEALRRLGVGAG
jgi:peptidoglycan/LPS O-acetylase OafA/YrhL